MTPSSSDGPVSSFPWTAVAWFVILIVTTLAFAQWPAYPYFLDSYYHLSVIQGFKEAGGVLLHAFWEAAPEGRPHLYPPLFHLLWLPLSLWGLPPLFIARLWSFCAGPSLLVSAWCVFSRIGGRRLACLTVIALSTPYSFFLAAVNYPPATWVLITGLFLILALSKKRWLAGGLLLASIFWLHAGLPWLFVTSLLLFSFFEAEFRKTCWQMIAVGILLSSPWLIHLYRHLPSIQFHARSEDQFLEMAVPLIGLSIIGLKRAWARRGIHRFFVALTLGFLPMVLGYRFRFFNAQGLFPWLLLTGYGLERIVASWERHRWGIGLGLVILLLTSPLLYRSPTEIRWVWGETTIPILAGHPSAFPRANATSLFHERFMKELSDEVKAQTAPEDLIYCSSPYFAGMLNVLTGRAITNEMLRELTERPLESQIRSAQLIVWLKNPEGRADPRLQQIVSHDNLHAVGETAIAELFKNPQATGRRQIEPPIVPWWIALGVIGSGLSIIGWDLQREAL